MWWERRATSYGFHLAVGSSVELGHEETLCLAVYLNGYDVDAVILAMAHG